MNDTQRPGKAVVGIESLRMRLIFLCAILVISFVIFCFSLTHAPVSKGYLASSVAAGVFSYGLWFWLLRLNQFYSVAGALPLVTVFTQDMADGFYETGIYQAYRLAILGQWSSSFFLTLFFLMAITIVYDLYTQKRTAPQS